MEYARAGNKYIIRLNRGEEILSSIMELCRKEKIKAGCVSGIGATQLVEAGFYDFEKKQYCGYTFEQGMEILSLLGNISTKEGEPYLHLHITLSDDSGKAFGGHLNKAIIGVTAEIFIDLVDVVLERQPDPVTGINLIKF